MRRGSAWPEPMTGGHARSPTSTAGARSISIAMGQEQQNVETVGRLFQAWNAGDHEAVLSMYHDDIVMTPTPNWLAEPGPWVGKEQVDRNQRDWAGAWQQIEARLERVEAAGDKVVCIGRWLSRGASSGVAGTAPIVTVFTLEDGLIRRFDWFEDPDEALRLAGVE